MNRGANAPKLITYGTIPVIIVLLAALIALPVIFYRARTTLPPASRPDTEDAGIEEKFRTLMDEHHLYLDPELTVQRLAKRLHLPARTLSAAINRMQGTNVSQYVNTFRLDHAARLLVDTKDSVSSIAIESGFMTRSNFYREFQRVYGQSPTEYRKSGTPTKEGASGRSKP